MHSTLESAKIEQERNIIMSPGCERPPRWTHRQMASIGLCVGTHTDIDTLFGAHRIDDADVLPSLGLDIFKTRSPSRQLTPGIPMVLSTVPFF